MNPDFEATRQRSSHRQLLHAILFSFNLRSETRTYGLGDMGIHNSRNVSYITSLLMLTCRESSPDGASCC